MKYFMRNQKPDGTAWGITMKKLLDQKGTAIVEFAIVLPLLMAIVFGIIEFAFILYDKQIITNASREGARAGIVSQSPKVTDAQIIAVVNTYVSNYLVSFAVGGVTTTISPSGNRDLLPFGTNLTVTVTYTYTFLVLPKFVSTLTGARNLVAATVMRLE